MSQSILLIKSKLMQMTSDQLSSNFAISKNPDHKFSKSEISQLYQIAFFNRKMIIFKTWYKIYNQEILLLLKLFRYSITI